MQYKKAGFLSHAYTYENAAHFTRLSISHKSDNTFNGLIVINIDISSKSVLLCEVFKLAILRKNYDES